MNILLSSYSFGAHRGSEAGVGWNVARGLALRGHTVVVITTYEFTESNHRTIKEEGLNIRLLEEDCGITDYPSASSYRKWQRRIGSVIKKEIIGNKYDVIHHVTFNQYRNIHDVFAAELPYLIGPVGGAEKIPFPLMLYGDLPLKMRMKEILRYVKWDALPLMFRCKLSRLRGLVLASNISTAERLKFLPIAPVICPAIAIYEKEILTESASLNGSAPYILFDGGLARPQKGTWLALRALRRLWDAGTRIPLRMVGVPEKDVATIRQYGQRISLPDEALQLEAHVSRDRMLSFMQQATSMLSCVYRDSGSMALLEALAQGCNIVCLDIPSQQWLPEHFCYKVQVKSRSVAMEQAIVSALHEATNSKRSPEWHDERCKWIRQHMTWESRISTLEQFYNTIVS